MFQGLLVQADSVIALPLLSGSAHCVITSPPYWGLRDYGITEWLGGDPACSHRRAQVGSSKCRKCGAVRLRAAFGLEPTPEEYIANLVGAAREVTRILRPDGVFWLNLGDCFAGSGGENANTGLEGSDTTKAFSRPTVDGTRSGLWRRNPRRDNMPAGNLVLIPNMAATALRADGWIVRQEVIWAKTSAMPEPVDGWRWEQHRIKVKGTSAPNSGGVRGQRTKGWTAATHPETRKPAEWKDCPGCAKCKPNDGLVLRKGSWRHTRSHEVVFMLVRQQQYWANKEAVKELAEDRTDDIGKAERRRNSGGRTDGFTVAAGTVGDGRMRNPRSVRFLPTASYPGAHFATYPPELIAPFMRSSCPTRCCPACGAGWSPVVERIKHSTRDMESQRAADADRTGRVDGRISGPSGQEDETRVIGYRPTCEHDLEPIAGLVVDPFCGSGTTGEVAREQGLRFIGFDLSMPYLSQQARVRALRGTPPGALEELPLFRSRE